MNIAYFAHELADAAVERRLRMLHAGGCRVSLFGFERDRGAGAPAAPAGAIVLGRTANQRLFQRALAILGAIPRALNAKSLWAKAGTIVARNLEMLILALTVTRLAGVRPRIVYECLDIHRLMLGEGPLNRLMRAVERSCLRRVDLVVTSSPAFEQRHFRQAQHYAGPVVLAENKVLMLDQWPVAASAEQSAEPPWTIAWCGVLRCARSFAALQDIARQGAGRVRVELWGAPALDQIPNFLELAAATPNMTYRGRYTPNDLTRIYGASHFAWAIDFYEAGGNSDWLLPNRLYEALAFGATPVAVDGVETASWLRERALGVILESPVEHSATAFFAALTSETYNALRAAVSALDPGAVRVTESDCRVFTAQITGAAA